MSTVEGFISSLLLAKDLPQVTIQEFRFTSLDGKTFQLVATIDSSGRGLFDNVVVVYRTSPSSFAFDIVNSDAPHLLASELLDLDGKGVYYLVVKELVAGYQGASSKPVFWHELLSLVNGQLKSVSREHPSFYQRKVMPEMAFLEQVLNPQGVAGDAKREDVARAEVAFVQFKYLREIKGKDTAGLDIALQWSESSNTTLQMLAISALGEIRRAEAIEAIKSLEHSENFAVSEAAKNMLTKVSRRGAVPSPEHNR